MSKRSSKKEMLITHIVDDYIERSRAGETPAVEEYLKKYPQYASDIIKSLTNEMIIAEKFTALKGKSPKKEPLKNELTAWNAFEAELRKSNKHRDEKKNRLKFLGIKMWRKDGYSQPALVYRFTLTTAVVLICLFFLLKPTSYRLSNLAQLEAVPYIPVITKSPTNIDSLFENAMQKYSQNDYQSTIAGCNQVLKQDPNRMDAHFYKGLSLLLDDQVDMGIEELRIVVESKDPIYQERACWYMGQGYLLKEDGEKARKCFQEVVQMEGNLSWDAEELIGQIELYQN